MNPRANRREGRLRHIAAGTPPLAAAGPPLSGAYGITRCRHAPLGCDHQQSRRVQRPIPNRLRRLWFAYSHRHTTATPSFAAAGPRRYRRSERLRVSWRVPTSTAPSAGSWHARRLTAVANFIPGSGPRSSTQQPPCWPPDGWRSSSSTSSPGAAASSWTSSSGGPGSCRTYRAANGASTTKEARAPSTRCSRRSTRPGRSTCAGRTRADCSSLGDRDGVATELALSMTESGAPSCPVGAAYRDSPTGSCSTAN
jgi:hypothetical protein